MTASSPCEKICRACSSVSVAPSGMSFVTVDMASVLAFRCHRDNPQHHFHQDQLQMAKVLPFFLFLQIESFTATP